MSSILLLRLNVIVNRGYTLKWSGTLTSTVQGTIKIGSSPKKHFSYTKHFNKPSAGYILNALNEVH
jgi:hypothetical protein